MTDILVVDDSAADRTLAGQVLGRESSWHVLYAEHGQAALERLRDNEVDLVVTDLQMPEIDGLGLVERVKELYPTIPVILMTGRGSEEIAVKALHTGAASYVPKKALTRDLVETVRRILETSREHASYRRLLGRMREASFVVENDLDLIASLVSYLGQMMRDHDLADDSDAQRLTTALDEALTNAYYHGNLEVGSEIRESDLRAYRALAERRASEPDYRDRRIRVTATYSDHEARFVIRDDGRGFDPGDVVDPTSPEFLERPAGRGIFLMRAFMDEVSFNEKGNEVTLVKRLVLKSPPTSVSQT